MKHAFCFVVTAATLLPSMIWALSLKVPQLSPTAVKAIEVGTIDNATGGCWTNSDSITSLLSQKLTSLGYNVVDEAPHRAIVSVSSSRTKGQKHVCLVKGPNCGKVIPGKCFGNVEMLIFKDSQIDGMDSLKLLYMNETTFVGYDSANGIAAEFVESFE